MTSERADRPAFGPADAATELRRLASQGGLEPRATNAVLAAAGHGQPATLAPSRPQHPGGLSRREIDALDLAARGLTRSRGDIKRFSVPQDPFPDARVQEFRSDQINPAAVQQSGQLALHTDEAQARNVTRLELHQHIDVAVGVEVIADRRSKQRQPRDMVPLAERLDGASVDGQVGSHDTLMIPPLPTDPVEGHAQVCEFRGFSGER